MIHYPIKIKYNNQLLFHIWFSGENDDFLVCNQNKLASFSNLNAAKNYSLTNKLHFVENESVEYDFDRIETWDLNYNKKDNTDLLNFWNLFIDIAGSLKLQFSGDNNEPIRNAIYEKLCEIEIWKNLHIASKIPRWTPNEIKTIACYINEGLKLYEANK